MNREAIKAAEQRMLAARRSLEEYTNRPGADLTSSEYKRLENDFETAVGQYFRIVGGSTGEWHQ